MDCASSRGVPTRMLRCSLRQTKVSFHVMQVVDDGDDDDYDDDDGDKGRGDEDMLRT